VVLLHIAHADEMPVEHIRSKKSEAQSVQFMQLEELTLYMRRSILMKFDEL
jgi:hypothetical protein